MTTTLLLRQTIKRYTNPRPRPKEFEVEDFDIEQVQPIRVYGDKLEIASSLMKIGRVYPLNYLGTKMVLWKSEDSTVDIFQIIEE